MVKPTYTIAMAAVLVVAAIAGVALMDDESDAVEAGAITSVSYAGDATNTTALSSDATSITINGGTGNENVLYWQTGTGENAKYYFNGQTVDIADISASEVSGGVLTFTAVTLENHMTITYDGVDYVISLTAASDASVSKSDPGWAAVQDIIKGLEAQGYEITSQIPANGAFVADAEIELTYSFGAVEWIVNGVTIMTNTGDNMTSIQSPASQPNYNFRGWALSEGGEVVIAYTAVPGAETPTYSMDGTPIPALNLDDFETTESTLRFYAVFEPVVYTVTFVADGQTVGTVRADYNTTIMPVELPAGYVAWAVDAEGTASFDFDEPITADTTVYAVAAVPSDVFTVTFVVDGEVIATYASNSVTLPDAPSKEGFEFVGWSINNSVIADPVNYEFTADTQFVALFQAIDVTTYTVTIQMADGTTQDIEVAEGEVPELPALAEGKVWALGDEIFNPETAIATDIVLKEVDEYYTVSFAVNGTVYDAYAQEVKYGEKASAPAQFVFPDGYSGWDFNFDTVITSDITVNAALIPAPAEEPAFYETTTGQMAIVIVVFVLLFFGYAVYSNMGGLKGKLFGYTISKKEKKE